MFRRVLTAAAAAASQLALAACDNGGSAVATRPRADAAVQAGTAAASAAASAAATSTGAEAAAARPAVTANRRETVDAKIERLFQRNGAAFGARSAGEYLRKIEAFTRNPPRDAETVRRPNGDLLIYQAATNTFAVVDRDGVPRTMFKPDEGAAYWVEQKARAPGFGQRRDDAG